MGPTTQQAEPCFWCKHHRKPKPPPLLSKRPDTSGHLGRDPSFSLPPRWSTCRPPRWPTATPHAAPVAYRSTRDPKVDCVCTPRSQPEPLIPGVVSVRRPPPANDESPARTCPRDDAVRFCCSLFPGWFLCCIGPGRPMPESAVPEGTTCAPTEVVPPSTSPS
jgi:hypothetical protein